MRRRAQYGEAKAFLTAALEYSSEECLLWPFSKKSGYGSIHANGRVIRAHLVICKAVHGPKPFANAEAAHTCGIPACVNPRHLRWVTPKENQADRLMHGTHNRGERHNLAKLTAEQVQAIRARTGQTQREIANEFGITRPHVSHILKHKTWKHIP